MRFEFLTVKNDLAAILYISSERIFINVDLPAPLAPIRQCTSPLLTEKSTPSNGLNSWKQLIDLSHFQNVVTFLHYVLLLCLCLLMHQIFQAFI